MQAIMKHDDIIIKEGFLLFSSIEESFVVIASTKLIEHAMLDGDGKFQQVDPQEEGGCNTTKGR